MPLPTSEAYQQFSQQGDPLADAVISALMQGGRRGGDLLSQVEQLAKQEGGIYQTFMDQISRVPSWADTKAMRQGQELFLRCSPLAIASFVLGSLLVTYTPPGSAKVLLHTGRLRQDVVRRLFETSTMVHAVMQPSALEVGAPGHQTIIRVRLLHAMVRYHVMTRAQWPHDELGSPINQQQMGLTSLGFSSLLINSMRSLGVTIPEDEARSYQLLWRYGNYLQGVNISLLPDNLEDEAALYGLFQRTVMTPDDNSRTLVAAVHQGLAWQSPFFLPQGALEAVSRRLLGSVLADKLAIKHHPVWALVLSMVAGLHKATALRYRIPGWRNMEVRAGTRYFTYLVNKGLKGKPADYALKTSS
ncbi:MAG: oxygenase MpaB family protein [Aquabacterium sp.]|nr:oxygenase MpaB family protein [Aquabacterium sp.]